MNSLLTVIKSHPVMFAASGAVTFSTGLVFFDDHPTTHLEASPRRRGTGVYHNEKLPSLEEQFGTSDGYFPSATKGALLSKPPGNKDHIVGPGYVAIAQRKTGTK
jgi:hypothetical protein